MWVTIRTPPKGRIATLIRVARSPPASHPEHLNSISPTFPRSGPGPRVSAACPAFCSTGSSVAIALREDHKSFTTRKSLTIRPLSRVSAVSRRGVSSESPHLRTNATDRLFPATTTCAFIVRHRRAPNATFTRTACSVVQTSWSDVWRHRKGNEKRDRPGRSLACPR